MKIHFSDKFTFENSNKNFKLRTFRQKLDSEKIYILSDRICFYLIE